MYTKPIEEQLSGNGPRPTSQQDAVTSAMAASRRLIDAAAKARNAYVEACQESVEAAQETLMGIPGVQESFPAPGSQDGPTFGAGLGFLPNNRVGEQWQKLLRGSAGRDEWVAACKRACSEYIDSCEQALFAAIDLRERMGDATSVDWIRSTVSTRAGAERDVVKAYIASARRLFK